MKGVNIYGVIITVYFVSIATILLHLFLFTNVISVDKFVGFPILHSVVMALYGLIVLLYYSSIINVEKFKSSIFSNSVNTVEDFFFQFLFLEAIHGSLFGIAVWLYETENVLKFDYFAILGVALGFAVIMGLKKPDLKGGDIEFGQPNTTNNEGQQKFIKQAFDVKETNDGYVIEPKKEKKKSKDKKKE